MLRYTPLSAPTKSVSSRAYVGDTARQNRLRSSRPKFQATQRLPRSAERKTPSWAAAAKTTPSSPKSGDVASATINGGGVGSCTTYQLAPRSKERRMPPFVPAKTMPSAAWSGETATAVAGSGSGKFSAVKSGRHVAPPSLVHSRPAPLAA